MLDIGLLADYTLPLQGSCHATGSEMPISEHRVRERLSSDYEVQSLKPDLVEATRIAFENLSDLDRDVVTHYVTAGGRRGWTEACGDRDQANNLRVRLHRAMKKMKRVLSQLLTENGIDPAEEIVGFWTSPEQMRHFITGHDPVVRDAASPKHYICVTIEVPEEDFDSEARDAIFDHFRFHQVRFSRSSGPPEITNEEAAQGGYRTLRPR